MLNVPSLMPAEIVISPPSSVGIVFENVTPAPAKAVPAMLTTTDEINTAKSFLFINIYPSFMKYFRLFILYFYVSIASLTPWSRRPSMIRQMRRRRHVSRLPVMIRRRHMHILSRSVIMRRYSHSFRSWIIRFRHRSPVEIIRFRRRRSRSFRKLRRCVIRLRRIRLRLRSRRIRQRLRRIRRRWRRRRWSCWIPSWASGESNKPRYIHAVLDVSCYCQTLSCIKLYLFRECYVHSCKRCP